MQYSQPLPRAQLKAQAKQRLSGNWGVVVPVTIFFFICIALLLWFTSGHEAAQLTENFASTGNMTSLSSNFLYHPHPIMGTAASIGAGLFAMSLLSFIGTILVSGILSYAYTAWFVKAATDRPEKMTFADFTEQFASWWRATLAFLWQELWSGIWSLVTLPAAGLITVGFIFAATDSDSSIGGILVLVGILLEIALGIFVYYKVLHYHFLFQVLADTPNTVVGVRKGMRLSIAILHGHIWQLFVLYLSFIPWILLIVVTGGLAALYVTPYMTMTLVYAYIHLRDRAFDEGRIDPQLYGYRNTSNAQSTAYGTPSALSASQPDAPLWNSPDYGAPQTSGTNMPPAGAPTVQPRDFALNNDAPFTASNAPAAPSPFAEMPQQPAAPEAPSPFTDDAAPAPATAPDESPFTAPSPAAAPEQTSFVEPSAPVEPQASAQE